MIIGILKNESRRYYGHYIIKFVSFISICDVINLDNVSSFMVFNSLYLRYTDLLQV